MMISIDLQKPQTDTKSVLISSLKVISQKAFFISLSFFHEVVCFVRNSSQQKEHRLEKSQFSVTLDLESLFPSNFVVISLSFVL